MLSPTQAENALLAKESSIAKVEDYVVYRNVYLFRVKFTSADESDYDPFFSVNMRNGEVKDFSVLTDGDVNEIAALFESPRKGH